MTKQVLAFDPGETTGWAYVTYDELGLLHHIYGTVKTHEEVWELLIERQSSIIVVESFHLYAHRASAQINSSFYTVEIIGVIRLWSQLMHVELVEQTAQYGKSIWTDGRLKKFDLYHTGTTARHSRDALRHALTFARIHRLPRTRAIWDD